MKLFSFIIIFFVVFIVSCVSPKNIEYKLKSTCNQDASEIFQKIKPIMDYHDFQMLESDPSSGFLKSKMVDRTEDFMGNFYEYKVTWIIYVRDGEVSAQCHYVYHKGTTVMKADKVFKYCGDNCEDSKRWYWDIRDELEKICGNMKIIEVQKGDGK